MINGSNIFLFISCVALLLVTIDKTAMGAIYGHGLSAPLPAIDASHTNLPRGDVDHVRASQWKAFNRYLAYQPSLTATWNPLTGTPRTLHRQDGFLTKPSTEKPEAVLKDFVRTNQSLFRLSKADLDTLEVSGYSVSRGSPKVSKRVKHSLTHIALDQRWKGRQVYPATLTATITDTGRIAGIAGEVVPGLSRAVNAVEPKLKPDDALKAAAASVGAPYDERRNAPLGSPRGPERRHYFSAGTAFNTDVPIRLIYYPISRTSVRLVWEVFAGKANQPYNYQVFVDAQNGEILRRQNVTRFDVPQWLVYGNAVSTSVVHPGYDVRPLDSPFPMTMGPSSPNGAQGAQVNASLIQTKGDPIASPKGWLYDAGYASADDQLLLSISGNNARAAADLNNNSTYIDDAITPDMIDAGGVPTRRYAFTADFSGTVNVPNNLNAAAVNAFFWANWFHDRMFMLGFDEGAGNYQKKNFSGLGTGDDPLVVIVQYPAFSNNAGIITREDGLWPLLLLSIFTGPEPDRDAALDQQILLHELTHGLTTRIAGGPNVIGMSGSAQALGLGEGFGDWYALALLSSQGQDSSSVYGMAGWVGYHAFKDTVLTAGAPPFDYAFKDNYYYGLRRYPYSTDRGNSPLTLADIDPGQYNDDGVPMSPFWVSVNNYAIANAGSAIPVDEIHFVGEIWALALWHVRAKLIGTLGWEYGNEMALQLVTDSLFFLPQSPTFIDARDALLMADRARTGGGYVCAIWKGFAERGLGYNAVTPSDGRTSGVREDFGLPPGCAPSPQCPDLVVQRIEPPTWDATNRESVIRAEIRNVGNAEAPPTLARVIDWGTLYDTGAPFNDVAETPALAEGQTTTVTFRLRNWALRPQSNLEVTADYKHMLVECFEENNTKEFQGGN